MDEQGEDRCRRGRGVSLTALILQRRRVRSRPRTGVRLTGLALFGLCLAFAIGEGALRLFMPNQFRPFGQGVAKEPWLEPHLQLGYLLSREQPWANSLGIRERPLMPKQALRILVLGDSVSWDSWKHNFPRMLESLIRAKEGSAYAHAEVFNAGIPGYGTYQEVTWYELFGHRLEPDVVVLQFSVNDVHRFLNSVCEGGRMLCLTPQVWAEFPWSVKTEWIRRSRLLTAVADGVSIVHRAIAVLRGRRYSFDVRVGYYRAWEDSTWPEIHDLLSRLRDRVRQDGAKLAILAVPLGDQLRPDYLARDRDYVLKPQRKLREIAERLQVPLLDLFETFRGHRDYLYDDIHLTKGAHAMVAEELHRFLRREGLLRRSLVLVHEDQPGR